MRLPSLCANCGAVANPVRTCRMCGSPVCTACYNMQTGMCDICSIKFQRRKKA